MKKVSGCINVRALGHYDFEFYIDDNATDEEIKKKVDDVCDYYISYDGKKILSKDVESGKYSEMKVKPVPTTEAVTDHTHAEEETKK